MKTRSNEPPATHGLPPPPAPPARDANPWAMSSSAGGPPASPPASPPRRRAQPDLSRSVPSHRRPLQAAPLLVLVFMASLGVRLAFDAWRDQDYAGMFAALAILSMVAFMIWRRSRPRR
jgi:hypothetical protein